MVILVFELKHLPFEFGKLARSEDGLGANEKRRDDLGEAVFAMDVEHVVEKSPLESRSKSCVDGPAGAGDFGAPHKIEEVEFLIELDVVFKREGKLPFFAELFHADIVFGARR